MSEFNAHLIESFSIELGIFISMVKLIGGGSLPARTEESINGFGTTKAVGEILFTDFLLPFEIASILLLAAIVGAVILAKQRVD